MTISLLPFLAAGALFCASNVIAQPDAQFNHDFDLADRRASELVVQLRCAQQMAGIRARGGFGAADTLGFTGQCIRHGGSYIGVYLDLDSAGTRHVRFSAVNLTQRTPHAEPLDTSALVAAARARRDALVRGGRTMERQFAPFILRTNAESLEVWLMPLSIVTGEPLSSGGERGYVYSADGRTVIRTVDAVAVFETITAGPADQITIVRRNARLPLLSDLLVANLQLLQGRAVHIELAQVTSTLVNPAVGGAWIHTKRTPP